jgi:hypothetical protein
MTLQARMSSEDRRLYNPSRDVAHNFQQVMELVAARLEDQSWPELEEILRREKVWTIWAKLAGLIVVI